MLQEKAGRLPLIGGVIAAIAASLCCVGPLVLVMLGIGGAWVGNLAVLEPFRPYFLGAAIIALFFAWKKIYRAPAAACTPGSLCAMPQTNRIYEGAVLDCGRACRSRHDLSLHRPAVLLDSVVTRYVRMIFCINCGGHEWLRLINGMTSPMRRGLYLSHDCWGVKACGAASHTTTDDLSMRYVGF